ncbi:MAG TPA: M20/M25/M40 family metallo-hydrolase [Candidatus Acidoferrum sp.]|nr:M20/M25/M40 family metallo-hydrolase [Candidatus Acidoferrum sp.]
MEPILRRLVAEPTITGDYEPNKRAYDYVNHYLSSRGMYVERFVFNGIESMVATTQPTKQPAVYLCAHMDVAPADIEQFELHIDGDKLYGRGTYDMKGSLAVYMQLVDELKGRLSEYDFGILITGDEEVGGYNGAAKLIELGYVPRKACVIPDGGEDWNIETFCKGLWFFRLTTNGVTAHGSRPWEGESALEKMLTLLDAIRALFDKPDKTPTTSTITVGTLRSGEAVNQIPGQATAEIDIRTTNLAEHFEKRSAIEALAKEHDAVIEMFAEGVPFRNGLDNPYVKQFADDIEAVTGRPAGTTFSYAGSDGRHFTPIGVPCVIVRSPGGGHHGPEEWISAKGLVQMHDILLRYLNTLAKNSGTPTKTGTHKKTVRPTQYAFNVPPSTMPGSPSLLK